MTSSSLLGGAYGPLNGSHLFFFVGAGGTVSLSTDGATWVSETLGGSYFDVATNGSGIFMAAGSDGVVDAFGGGAGARFDTSVLMAGIAYGNGIWLTVGGYLTPQFTWQACWASSTDNGAHWNGPFLLPPDGDAIDNFNAVVYSNGLFTAVRGNGKIYQSDDGQDLTIVAQPTSFSLREIEANGNTLVAVGGNGTICRSTNNGATWNSGTLAGNPSLGTVVYGGGSFVAAGLNGAIFASLDGASWSACSSSAQSFLQGAAYGNNTWVLSGQEGEVLQASCLADLAGFVPTGWSGSLVVSPLPGTNTDGAISPSNSIYIDGAWINRGWLITPPYTVQVRLNGQVLGTIASPATPPNTSVGIQDVILAPLPVGDYTLEFVLDSAGVVSESDSANNTTSKTFSVAVQCPADFDDNGIVGVPDIFAFLSSWFAQQSSADFDDDGQIQVPDIFAFLSAWFGGCV